MDYHGFPPTAYPRDCFRHYQMSFCVCSYLLAAFRGNSGHSNWSLSCHCVFCYFFQGDLFASIFLIKNGALVNAATLGAQETPLHLVALYSSKKYSADVMSEMAQIAEALLQAGANPNMQDSKGRWVPLMVAYNWHTQSLTLLNLMLIETASI